MPKNIDVNIQNTRVLKCFQKTKASIKGNPVCPEKNKSAPVLNMKKFGLFDIAWSRITEFPSMML